MKKLIIVIAASLLLAACGKRIHNKEEVAYAFVGCHEVIQNPASTGEKAFLGFIDLEVGDRIWFKRVNDNGSVKPVATSTPC